MNNKNIRLIKKMQRILITGGTGFIGSNLIRKIISSNNKIYSINRNVKNCWRVTDIQGKINMIKTDLTNRNNLEKVIKKINPDIVFHLASYGVNNSEKNFSKILNTNAIGSYNLFSILAENRPKKIINVGSVFEYGQLKHKGGFSEEDCSNPFTKYGMSKNYQTNLANYFVNSKSLPIVTLRLFTPFGMYENKNRLVSQMMISKIKNQKMVISSAKSTRDFVFIDDVIDAFVKASKKKNIEGEIFNIGLGKSHSVEQIVNFMNKLSESKTEIQIKNVPVNDYDILGGKGYASILKAKKILNWSPKNSIEEGLAKTFSWYKKNISLYN